MENAQHKVAALGVASTKMQAQAARKPMLAQASPLDHA